MSFIGNVPAEAYSPVAKDTFSGNDSTTDFTLSIPATTNSVEVFVENVQQEPTTAYTISGTTLSFTAAPVTGTNNIYVIHRGPAVQTVVPPAGVAIDASTITASGLVTAQDGLVVDNDGATVATFDRATSDGTIAEFQKDGTTVGFIGTHNGDVTIGAGDTGMKFDDGSNRILPWNTDTNSAANNIRDLGGVSNQWKDIYVAGGITFDNGSNYLDDYEEGTWTPSVTNHSGSTSSQTIAGRYVKIGRICHFQGVLTQGSGSVTGTMTLAGFPFTAAGTFGHISMNASSGSNIQMSACRVVSGNTAFSIKGFNGTDVSSGSGDVNICFEGTFEVS